VTRTPVRLVGAGDLPQRPAAIVLGRDEPVALRTNRRPVLLSARLWFNVEPVSDPRGRLRAVIAGYAFTLLDENQREILAFHLHTDGQSHIQTPHLHLGAGAGQLRSELSRAHIPTGPITLAAIVRLAVEAFSIRPMRGDWDAVLARSDAALAE
jgi:hypothetical protein